MKNQAAGRDEKPAVFRQFLVGTPLALSKARQDQAHLSDQHPLIPTWECAGPTGSDPHSRWF